MGVQPRLITLNEFNPRDKLNPLTSHLMYVQYLGKDELSVIDDAVLYALIEEYGLDGEEEIVKMVYRGQVFQSQAERVLSVDRYMEVGKLVSCKWS